MFRGCVSFSSLGLERDKFDNKTVTFEEHIKEEHNMWHYLFFIVLVKVKDSTEYTGPESYVAEMIKVSFAMLCVKYGLFILLLILLMPESLNSHSMKILKYL